VSGTDSRPPRGASRPHSLRRGAGAASPLCLRALPLPLCPTAASSMALASHCGPGALGHCPALAMPRPPPACSSAPSPCAPPAALPPHTTLLCSIWDDGTANPEPCLDQFTLISKYGALGWLLGGMSVFAVLGTAATLSAPEKRVPWVSAPGCLQMCSRACPLFAVPLDSSVPASAACISNRCSRSCRCRRRAPRYRAPLYHICLAVLVCVQAQKEVVVPPEVANFNVRA
jgi:hypothetical protein